MSKVEQHSLLIAPGQGSQRPGMYVLAEHLAEVRETYDLADEISLELFGSDQILGQSISQWAKQAASEELAGNTVITQPLIVATTIGLIKYIKKQEAFATAYGHSLGEISALYAAGCLSEYDAIKLAMLRGVHSRDASQQRPGGMAALLNIPHDVKERFKFGENEGVVVSTTNSPDQFTISGYKDKVDAFTTDIRERYQRVKGLTKEEKRQLPNAVAMKIEGGFHSFMMRPAQKAYRADLEAAEMSVPTDMNFFSNYSHDYEGDPDTIREHLVSQLIHPVDFWLDINKLIMNGHVKVVEVGAGSVLTTGLREQQAKGALPAEVEFVAIEEDILKIAA